LAGRILRRGVTWNYSNYKILFWDGQVVVALLLFTTPPNEKIGQALSYGYLRLSKTSRLRSLLRHENHSERLDIPFHSFTWSVTDSTKTTDTFLAFLFLLATSTKFSPFVCW
jgi:hypothetical protein